MGITTIVRLPIDGVLELSRGLLEGWAAVLVLVPAFLCEADESFRPGVMRQWRPFPLRHALQDRACGHENA